MSLGGSSGRQEDVLVSPTISEFKQIQLQQVLFECPHHSTYIHKMANYHS